ncbi:MAG: SDR family oxidoreductase [Chloroflexota bacterium]|nr:SDR family oxidoreductase [Chloroflexia bacterium]MDQ3443678.1 SDR family oxidoreductase [Chloroflexota bacterium]
MTETSSSLKDQVAIVTGGARGIGLAVATRLVADGASVVIADIDADAASQAAQALGKHAVGLRLDVTDEEQWAAGVDSVGSTFGPVSILVNNAGIAGRAAPTWELSVAEWQQVIAIDLGGVFVGCRAVLPGMIERGYGRIVNIASIAGKEGNPNAVPYSAAKAGVIGLTKAIAKEVATSGVIVNAVTPAVIETEILKQLTDEHVAYMTSKIPMGRVGQPEEVAALVRFLCSNEISFSTGAVFDISGGRATY